MGEGGRRLCGRAVRSAHPSIHPKTSLTPRAPASHRKPDRSGRKERNKKGNKTPDGREKGPLLHGRSRNNHSSGLLCPTLSSSLASGSVPLHPSPPMVIIANSTLLAAASSVVWVMVDRRRPDRTEACWAWRFSGVLMSRQSLCLLFDVTVRVTSRQAPNRRLDVMDVSGRGGRRSEQTSGDRFRDRTRPKADWPSCLSLSLSLLSRPFPAQMWSLVC